MNALDVQAKAMAEIFEKLGRVGTEHDLFQRALWIALEGKEIVVRDGDGGLVEYFNTDDGGVCVRRSRKTDKH